MRILVWDLECRENPEICGWKNHAAMGISFGCFHADWVPDPFVIFGEDSLDLFVDALHEADIVAGYNTIPFDNKLFIATWERVKGTPFTPEMHDILLGKTYDIRADLLQTTRKPFLKGWKLDVVARHNCKAQKSGDGANAPGLWKDGKHDELRSYVRQDVVVERELLEVCRDTQFLRNPDAAPYEVRLMQATALFGKVKEKMPA